MRNSARSGRCGSRWKACDALFGQQWPLRSRMLDGRCEGLAVPASSSPGPVVNAALLPHVCVSASSMSSFLSEEAPEGPVESYHFGCELSSKTTYYTFKVDEEDEYEHNLSLCTISLGEGVKDEYNVVEVTARNHIDEDITVPIANLKLSCQTMVSLDNFVIQPPVTFRLKSGSGPVVLSGQVIVIPPDMDSEEEEEEEDEDDDDLDEEEDDDEEEELVPIKPANKKLRK